MNLLTHDNDEATIVIPDNGNISADIISFEQQLLVMENKTIKLEKSITKTQKELEKRKQLHQICLIYIF
jgi:hypothetical protein